MNPVKKVTCIHCGKQTELKNESGNLGDILATGFNVVFDVTNGLSMKTFCPDCSEKIKKNVAEIEEILGTGIEDVSLMRFSSKKISSQKEGKI